MKVKISPNDDSAFLFQIDDIAALASPGTDVLHRIATLEKENASLHNLVKELTEISLRSEKRIQSLESRLGGEAPAPAAASGDADDDDVDLFGSDSDEEESEAAAKIRQERLAAYDAKKSKLPKLIAKSNLILDVKPWDDETDMKAIEQAVCSIQTDGLLWGTARLVPLAFGIHKLSISCVIEDEKVSVDWLTEEIAKNEDLVQSVDIGAFNKV